MNGLFFHPVIWGLAVTLIILLAIMIWMLLRMHKRSLKLYLTLPLSLVLFAMSAGIIPLFTRLTSSPWSSIRLFAPDIAYLTLGIVASLALMGLVLMYGRLSAVGNISSRLPGALDMKCNQ